MRKLCSIIMFGRMCFWRFVIVLFFAALCRAKIFKVMYEIRDALNATSGLQSRFPFDCTHIGQYPDPYDCGSFYKCEKIVDACEEENGSKRCLLNSHYEKDIGCIKATERCTCPPGTFWAGPTAGCINDAKDMRECCSFRADCIYGQGNDFGSCSLSVLGYRYFCCNKGAEVNGITCHNDAIHVGKIHSIRFPGETSNPPIYYHESDKIVPVCEPVWHFLGEIPWQNSALFGKLLTISEEVDGSLLNELNKGKSPSCGGLMPISKIHRKFIQQTNGTELIIKSKGQFHQH